MHHVLLAGLASLFLACGSDSSTSSDTSSDEVAEEGPAPAGGTPTQPSLEEPAPEETSPEAPAPEADPSEEPPAPSGPVILARGEIALPAANAFTDPGFHEVLTVSQTLPLLLSPSSGRKLVIALRDLGRPQQTCGIQHPLSGCATVDWSDAEGRPGVPPGGVFNNNITLQMGAGARRFFLSEGGTLANRPDSFRPG